MNWLESLESSKLPAFLIQAKQELLRRELEGDWSKWLRHFFNLYLTDSFGNDIPFAPHHDPFWQWVWNVQKGQRSRPQINIWPRGGAKSTNAEMAVVALGAMGKRKYVLYVCATQDQADDHVSNIAAMLESSKLEEFYPDLANRKVGKYGGSKGWRRNRLRTASGFTVDAIGLDSAARGAKVDEDRPDLFVFDDLDGELDTPETTEKKIKTLTRKLIPAGARDATVLGVQNLVHLNSIFSRLSDGRAKFLIDRDVSGPIPAIYDLDYEETKSGHTHLTAGVPSWEGMDLGRCQEIVDDVGIQAFLAECQHLVDDPDSKIFLREWFTPKRGTRYDVADSYIWNSVEQRYIYFDTALSEKETAAYTAWVVLEVRPDYRVFLREAGRDRLDFPGLLERIEAVASHHNRDRRLVQVTIEDKASGISAIQTLRSGAHHWLAPYIHDFDPGSRDKVYRARQASFWCRARCVALPGPSELTSPWLATFEKEIFDFPMSEFADQVDAFSMGLIHLEPLLSAGWEFRGMVA